MRYRRALRKSLRGFAKPFEGRRERTGRDGPAAAPGEATPRVLRVAGGFVDALIRVRSDKPQGDLLKAAVPDALELTSKQLDELRGLLDAKRRELREGQRSTSVAALERQADEMDAASDATAEAETLGLSQHNNRLWKEIRTRPREVRGRHLRGQRRVGRADWLRPAANHPVGPAHRSRRRGPRAARALDVSIGETARRMAWAT